MAPGNQAATSRWGPRLAAGIEAGVLGGVAMIASVAAVSALSRQSIWTAPNLFASLLYGRAALGHDFHSTTMSGLALELFTAGLLGLAFSVYAGGSRSRFRVFLLATLTALIWYYLSQTLLWRKLGLAALMYAAPKTMLFGHICFGLVLGLYPGFVRAAERSSRPPAGPPPGPPPPEAGSAGSLEEIGRI